MYAILFYGLFYVAYRPGVWGAEIPVRKKREVRGQEVDMDKLDPEIITGRGYSPAERHIMDKINEIVEWLNEHEEAEGEEL